MNRDFEDINRILSLFPVVDGSTDNDLYVLEKICEQTEDSYRLDKYDYFQSHLNECISWMNGKSTSVIDLCRQSQCSKCHINKWCNHYRNNLQKNEENATGPVYADFFCGAGGLSWGFHRAGYRMSLANDIQECCIDTIALNHPEVPGKHIISADINDVIDNIENISRYKNVDVVVGGPPCQGFSMANRQRLIDDPRNHLYKSFIKAIAVLTPQFFVMENVRGMLAAKKQIEEDFEAVGYTATAHLLNAKNFGVPQNRERVIFIGNRLGIDNEEIFRSIFDIGRQRKSYVLSDAIDGLALLSAKTKANATELEDEKSGYTFSINGNCFANDYIKSINEGRTPLVTFNHKARYNNARDIEIFGRLDPGDNSADPKIADIMPYKRREKIFKDKYFKLEPDKPCKTITAHMKFDCNMYIHPSQARGLTPREAARIQSYPDDYFFRGSYTKTYMQVGNSVPPLLSEAIATAIKNKLEEVH